MTTIGFIRHGATDWNRLKKSQGQSDIPLNEEGRKQAELLACRLAQEHWEFIFSSDLSRARETAEIIAAYTGIKVCRFDRRLRERGLGRLEGTTVEQRVKTWGSNWKTMEHGVEPRDKIIQRGLSFLEEITQDYNGHKILVVSHGGLINTTMKHLLNITDNLELKNASLSILLKEDDSWKCQLMNCTRHLTVLE